jgi:hypothetical protein
MTLTENVREAVFEIGAALRRPEAFARRWRDRARAPGPTGMVFPVLLANAALGLAAFGLVMGLHTEALTGMLSASFRTTVALGLPWLIALPALYIITARWDRSSTRRRPRSQESPPCRSARWRCSPPCR